MAAQANNSAMDVRHFRQILLWPLQLMPIRRDAQIQEHWEVLDQESADNPWRELLDEFTPDGCRLWDAKTGEKLDKDRFRRDLGGVIEHYREVAQRIGAPL